MYIETIKNKNDESYRTSINCNGRKIKSPCFNRKNDCKEWYKQQQAQLNKMRVYGQDNRFYQKKLFNDFCDDWLVTKKAQNVARSTYQNYESNIRVHFKPFFIGKDIKNITKNDIEKLQINLKENHNCKGVNLIIVVLKSIFNEAIKEGYLFKSPCEYIINLKEEKRPDVFWTKEEIESFLRVNHSHELYDLFLVAMNTGLRRGELAGLLWSRVNFERNILGVTRMRTRTETKETTKNHLIRWVPMNDVVKATLTRLKNKKTESDYVFLNKEGQPINIHHMYRTFQRAQVKAGIKNLIRFHDLRHTFASNFVIDGRNIYDLQKMLGHTDVAMTQRYAHLSDESQQQAIAGFNLGMAKSEPMDLVSEFSNVVDIRDRKNDEDTQNLPSEGIL